MFGEYLFDHLDTVAELLALSPFGLITDVDGTISEIAPSPEKAHVTPVCREHLAALTKRLELVAAISGRPVLEAREMIGVEGMVYIGSHGLERWEDGRVKFTQGVEEYPAKVMVALEELGGLRAMEGIALENKGVALAIHYRRCPDRESARRAVLEKIANSPTCRSEFQELEGRMVVELRPRQVGVNKGTAVKALVERYHLRGGIYLGDDISDVDAFGVMHTTGFKGLGLGVIDEETPDEVIREADFTLNGVGDVERFFKWLVAVAPALRQ
ncbi:MAG: hypothetical protein AMJ37_03550 [Dehalococcoidia bacterium DG_18]|nr:MAG: hypothetical protein AMJ37_03550 [Dehalococcoidia bacterium DG_18]